MGKKLKPFSLWFSLPLKTPSKITIELVNFGTEGLCQGKTVQSHSHSHYEIHYIAEGKILLKIQKKKFLLNKGVLYLTRPGTWHYQKAIEHSKVCSLGYNVSYWKGKPSAGKVLSGKNLDWLASKTNKICKVEKKFYKFFLQSREIASKNKTMLKQHFLKLLNIVSKNLKNSLIINEVDRFDFTHPSAKLVQQAIGLIRENISTKINIHEIAEELHVSYRHFSRIFKEVIQKTPSTFIIYLRVEKAKELLKNPKLSCKQILPEIGIEDIFYFYRMFKKITGTKVSAYRRQMLHSQIPPSSVAQ